MSDSSSLASDSENVYIVEEILDKRIENDRVEYLVKWVGYEG